jgi:catechol 2,3-dioxygenase-like lactoylglutathione lyase family enzyme
MPEAAISKHFISCAAVFIVADIHRAVAFYRDQLGFEISDIWGDPPSFAIADSARASIMLKQGIDQNEPYKPMPNTRQISGLWDAYVWVQDLEAVISFFAGANTAHSKPEKMPHGCTEIVVTDPDGYRICFGFCP